MLSLVDFSFIIEEHYKNLIEDSSKKTVITLFFIIPVFLSSLLIIFNKLLNTDIINTLIVAFSIFTAFLPNVIFIQLGMRKDLKKDKTLSDIALKVSEHLYTDSVYSLLISILMLSILVALLIINQMGMILSLIVYTLTIHFLITFLMVVQRVFVLFFPHDLED